MTAKKNEPGPVLVLGATGRTGRRIAKRLSDRGVPVRYGSRTAEPAFNWSDRETWGAALRGVRAIFVVYPQDLPIELATERIGALLTKARVVGVERAVLLSGRGEPECLVQERLLQESGLEWTVVRSAWFNQNFTEGGFAEMVQAGELILPTDRAPEPFVDLEDLADVVVASLTEARHVGQIYDVTGPRLLGLPDVANELSRAKGVELAFVPVAHSDFLTGLEARGATPEVVGLMDFLFETLLDGRNAHLGNGVQRALGREPIDFSEFAARELSGSRNATRGNTRTLNRFVTEFVNAGDESTLEELVHDDYVYRSPGEEVHGRDGLAAMFRGYRSAFPDLALAVHDVLVDGDRTVLDCSLSGTHRGDFMGLPASGRTFTARAMVVSRYRDGKIADEWEILDVLGMMEQLAPGARFVAG